ncbi:MAG: alcohol dehydrogenase catalytic domain-containing protein [Deltaproteobacteria bacterium]|nr:alcohol dehydrogenase catalytic domain-containing protein [Deltaproteobacteria bacterium]
MRAVRVGANGGIEVVDVPAPSGDGVRVRMKSASICGSDLHMIEHGATMGFTLGHELAGELDDGTPVGIEPLVPCGACECCVAGDYQLCRSAPQMIFGIMRDGGMADELIVPPRCLVPLPSGIPVRDACLIEPLAVCIHGLRKAGVHGGLRVAVVGGGSIGLCAVAAARFAGAEVGLEARYDAQKAAGERLGARPIDGEYDVVLECAGSDSAVSRVCELAKPGGVIVLLSSYWGPLTLPAFLVMLKELRLQPSSMYGRHAAGRDIEGGAALLASNKEIAPALITHRLPLEAAPEAFQIARDRKAGAIKVVLEP